MRRSAPRLRSSGRRIDAALAAPARRSPGVAHMQEGFLVLDPDALLRLRQERVAER
jgi:hypothetical protein